MSSETWPQPEESDPLPSRRGLLTVVFLVVVIGGLLVAWLGRSSGQGPATVGSPAPRFGLTMFDGSRFDLTRHISEDGRPVVVNLWASWCAPCRKEIPTISEWAIAHPEVYVIGVAVEDVEADARALAAELGPSYDLAMGTDEFRAEYPSIGLPATYIVDGKGRVADVIFGIVSTKILDEAVAAIAG